MRQIWYGFFLGSGAVRIAPAIRTAAAVSGGFRFAPGPSSPRRHGGNEEESLNRESAKTGIT